MTVKEWLKQDRQWPHKCRVAYAEQRLKESASPEGKQFWAEVLAANDKRVVHSVS